MVANLASKYSYRTNKKLGIIVRGPRLLPQMPHRASEIAEDYLKSQGIFIYLNTEYNDKSMEELGYELSIDCTGMKYPGPRQFMQGELADCLNPRTGQIFVNEFL